MNIVKSERHKYEVNRYRGSLDFPCDFCDHNSYDNMHFKKGDVLIVVCKDCLDKAWEAD